MATQVQFRRGTAAQNNSFTGGAGELSINLSSMAVRVHDGATAGGFELARADLTNVTGNIPAQPGGVNASVQFNNLGTMTGSSQFTYDSINQLVTMPNVSIVGNISSSLIPDANVTYDIGNATHKWRDLYLSGNTIYIGNANIKSYQQIVLIQGLSITANGAVDVANAPPSGGLFVASNAAIGGSANVGANLAVTGGANVGANLAVVGNANVGSNLTVANALSSNSIVANTGNIVNISANTANIIANLTAGNITSNGTLTIAVANVANLVTQNLTITGNIAPNKINFIDTVVQIGAANAEVTVQVAGVSNVAVFSTTGTETIGLKVTGTSNLGAPANVKVTGGSNGQFLQTDGAGNLAWATVASNGIANGTSNVLIATANGQVRVGVNGQSNVAVFDDSGLSVTGALDVSDDTWLTGNANVGKTLSTANLLANGNVAFTGANVSLGAVANLKVTGGSNLQFLQTDGAGNLSWAAVNSDRISNGNSNVFVYANNSVMISSQGNANVLEVWGNGVASNKKLFANTGLEVTGNADFIGIAHVSMNLYANGNLYVKYDTQMDNDLVVDGDTGLQGNVDIVGKLSTFGNVDTSSSANVTLGPVANIHVAGGTSGQFLQTDGNGLLTWATVANDSIANGNSNVKIYSNGGAVTTSANGQANIITVNSNGTHAQTTITNDATITGNLTVQGNTIYINTTTQAVTDPVGAYGTGANNSPLLTDDSKDRGIALHTYGAGSSKTTNGVTPLGNTTILLTNTSGLVVGQEIAVPSIPDAIVHGTKIITVNPGNVVIDTATSNSIPTTTTVSIGLDVIRFMGWTRANTEFTLASNASVDGNNTVTINTLGNVRVNHLLGNVTGATVTTTGQVTVGANLVASANVLVTGNIVANSNFDIIGDISTASNLTVADRVFFTNASNVDLGNIANIYISGGTNGQFLQTDGTGNVSWGTVATDKISNGNSNVFVYQDSNIGVTSAGNANVVVFTGTGANVNGTLKVTGNTALANANASGTLYVSGNTTLASNLAVTNNIVGTGNLDITGKISGADDLQIAGNVNFTGSANVALGAVANVKLTGGSNLQFLQTDGNGNLAWANVNSDRISNGNSNVFVYANGNVAITSAGNANIVTVTGTGANIAGTLDATGNVTVANLTANGNVTLGNVGNVHITGGSNGQYLQTDGNGNIVWSTVTQSSPQKYTKEWNIDPAAGLDTNSGAEEKPFLTIAKALTVAQAGDVIYLHAGAYTESVTLTHANVNIVGAGGNSTVLSGTWTYNTTGTATVTGVNHTGSTGFTGTGVVNVISSTLAGATSASAGYVNLSDSDVTTSFSITSSARVNADDTTITSMSLNGATAVVFVSGSLGLTSTTVLRGRLHVKDSALYSSGGGLSSLTVGTNGTLFLENSKIYGADESVLGFAQVAGAYNVVNTVYDEANTVFTGAADDTIISHFSDATVDVLTVNNLALLGNVGNVQIYGGVTGQVLKTDGAGTLSWATISSESISNGNSNVRIANNSTIMVASNGVANVAKFDELNANFIANVAVGNRLTVTGITTLSGNVSMTGANISLGNLGNIRISGGAATQFLSTDGAGNLTWAGVDTYKISNGTSNVFVYQNGNVAITSAGNANTLVVSGPNVKMAGNLEVVNNVIASGNLDVVGDLWVASNLQVGDRVYFTTSSNVDLGVIGNVHISGGSNGQFLKTNGSGTLSWANAGAGGSNTQVQFNDSNVANGNSKFTFDKTTSVLTVDTLSVQGNGNVVASGALAITATGSSSNLSLNAGNGSAGSGGNVIIRGGTAPSGVTTAGAVTLTGGAASGGTNGGNINIVSGNSAAGQAGNIYITPGTGAANSNGQTVFSGKVSLGNVANVSILGGSNNQILTTDGNGNLTWGSGSNLTFNQLKDGNSNVRIASTDGNVVMAVNSIDEMAVLTSVGMLIGNGTALGGLTNPIIGAKGNANSYVQVYNYNKSNTVNASSDFVAYPDNGTDTAGWIDMGITSNSFTDSTYSVTARNEGYLFMSAPAGSGTSGNLVIATSSTGSNNAIEFYTGGFNSAKGANRPMYLASNEVKITGNLQANGANVTLGAVGNLKITGASDGALLTANGTGGNLAWSLVIDGGTA